jgi:hypothetical protein
LPTEQLDAQEITQTIMLTSLLSAILAIKLTSLLPVVPVDNWASLTSLLRSRFLRVAAVCLIFATLPNAIAPPGSVSVIRTTLHPFIFDLLPLSSK